jgi:hypothetical protein
MDTEKEINSLAAETLAYGIILGNVLSKLALIPSLRSAIEKGFDQSTNVAHEHCWQVWPSGIAGSHNEGPADYRGSAGNGPWTRRRPAKGKSVGLSRTG